MLKVYNDYEQAEFGMKCEIYYLSSLNTGIKKTQSTIIGLPHEGSEGMV